MGRFSLFHLSRMVGCFHSSWPAESISRWFSPMWLWLMRCRWYRFDMAIKDNGWKVQRKKGNSLLLICCWGRWGNFYLNHLFKRNKNWLDVDGLLNMEWINNGKPIRPGKKSCSWLDIWGGVLLTGLMKGDIGFRDSAMKWRGETVCLDHLMQVMKMIVFWFSMWGMIWMV